MLDFLIGLASGTHLTCPGPQCTGGVPVHPLHYGVLPTSHQTLAGTEAETHPS